MSIRPFSSANPPAGMNRDVIVIGGGVIGLSTAFFLGRSGHRVTVLDRDGSRRESCSDKNAGMVVPSHFIPLAAPGMISLGLKWMLNSRSPFPCDRVSIPAFGVGAGSFSDMPTRGTSSTVANS